MRSLLASALILALAALPLAAQAGPGRGTRGERIARALQLTEAQKTSIKALRQKYQPDLQTRREATRQARQALAAALREPATADAQLRGLYDKAAAARFELILARRALRKEVQALLTPEQRLRAAELRGVARGRRQERLREQGWRRPN